MVGIGPTRPVPSVSLFITRSEATQRRPWDRESHAIKNRRQLASDAGHLGFGIVAPDFPRENRGWFDPTQTRGRGAWGLRAGAGPNRLRQRR